MSDIFDLNFDFVQFHRKMAEFEELSEKDPVIKKLYVFMRSFPGMKANRKPVSAKVHVEVTYEDEVR